MDDPESDDPMGFDPDWDEDEPLFCDCPGHVCGARVEWLGERCAMCAEACPPSCPV